jgi:hypothetical protein
MKSLVNAINNLANSISKLADSRNIIVPKPISNPYASVSKIADSKKTVVPQTTTSNPYAGSVNITSGSYTSKDTEGWYTLSAAEREQLYYVYKAITVNGADPNYTSQDIAFAKLMDNIYANWPALHSPIQKLIALKKRSIQDKLNQKYTSSKEVWKFPHQHENP